MNFPNLTTYLEQQRTRRGLSERAFCRKAGVARSEYRRLTNGQAQDVKVGLLWRLAHALGVQLRTLASYVEQDFMAGDDPAEAAP